jgi:hypothetical protein
MSERFLQAFEPVVLPLGEERPAVEPAGVAQHGGHEIDLHGFPGDQHDLLAKVDLQLLARLGLEADGG